MACLRDEQPDQRDRRRHTDEEGDRQPPVDQRQPRNRADGDQ
jgi:hypothetical protein